MTTIISLDCEANGLGGQVFAAAAVLTDETGEVDTWQARCPIFGRVDPWVRANVLPVLDGMPETAVNYREILAGWRDFLAYARQQRSDVLVVGHVVWPVEARFLAEAHASNLFGGPFPLLDVAFGLLLAGHDPTLVDAYLATHGLPVPDGSPHDPLYDARAAEAAYRHLMGALGK